MCRAVTVVVLSLLLVLAGCAAPMADADSDASSTGTEETEVTVYGDLPFDANETFERTQILLGVETEPPTVYVEEPTEGGTPIQRDPSSFYAVMGIPLPQPGDADEELTVGGVASPMQAVYVIPDDTAEPAAIEQVLVHEFVHAVQFQTGALEEVQSSIPPTHWGTTDAELAYLSVAEGGAVYASSAYTERYETGVDPEDEMLDRLYSNASLGTKLTVAPYYYGYHYVDAHATDPETHWDIYETPPVTMQEVRSGEPVIATGEASLQPFEASLADNTSHWEAPRGSADVMGEYVIQQVLATQLSTNESHNAAIGWEYDYVLRVSDTRAEPANPDTGYAWTVRFEDEANASTFEQATVRYLEERTNESGTLSAPDEDLENRSLEATNVTWQTDEYAFSLERVDTETVTLLGGSEAFVGASTVTVAGDGSDIEVTTEDERTNSPATADAQNRVLQTAGMPMQAQAGI